MKPRKLIALLLLAVYLFTAGGPALAALTCRCVAARAHDGTAAASCCTCCSHEGDHPAARADLSAPCCGRLHSTAVELYTGVSSDDERQIRCIAGELPSSLAAELPDRIGTPELSGTFRPERRSFVLQERYVRSTGLRAPPVLV